MSSRRSHLSLIVLILAALAGVVLIGWSGSPFHKSLHKGLDLQGGLEVVLKAQPPKGHQLTSSDLDRSVTIMRNRVDRLGVSEPHIQKQGSNEIVIQLAGVHDPAAAAKLIGSTAKLELYDLEPALVPPSVSATGTPIATTSLYDLLSRVQASAKQGAPSQYALFKKTTNTTGVGKNKKTTTTWHRIGGPTATLHRDPTTGNPGLLDPYGGKVPKDAKILTVPARTVVITCSVESSTVCPGDANGVPPAGQTDYYLFKNGYYPHDRYATDGRYPNMDGNLLSLSGTRQDFDPNTGDPVVLMQFKSKGNKIFKEVTKNEAIRGSIQQTPQHFAIVLDNQIRSWPQIDYTQNPQGIDPTGSGAQITGLQSLKEAKDLALVLQTGALPVNFITLERTDVSATLGKDSLKQARNAAIGGLIAVMIFLLLAYRFLGLVAVLGLGIYAALMYGAILIFGVTLTLPGFAGLILTIGVAADANIVVFERIKEEVRAGKTMRKAIADGYAKGFHTIIDANVVTVITALILFAVASAEVKGFALMLLIGTVVSLVTAVAATRAMLGLLSGFKWFDNPSFMGAAGQQGLKFLQIDFMRRRKLWFAISGVVIAISVVSLAVRGLNLGIDFKGGVQITFNTKAYTSLSEVRAQTAAIGHSDAIVQGRGSSTNGGENYRNFQIQLKKLNNTDQSKLQNLLSEQVHAQGQSIKNVSSSFGRQIARAAILAILFSLLMVTLYIAIRFHGIAFAVPVVLAMIHDVIITIGVYSVTGREVTEATVAAVLTVLGYSIYDTIIIFDRIRENIPILRRAPFATIANISLWETIRRSLATTFITLLPVGALFFFGGATLKDFAFALLVGITSGAYSSIFIAAPLLTWWKEREPEYAKKKAQAAALPEGAAADPILHEAEQELIDDQPEEAEAPVDAVETGVGAVVERKPDDEAAKRARRRQRRQSRPHGRAR